MQFRFRTYAITFRALDRVHFPKGKAGNVFRGALGIQFRNAVCDPACPGAKTCPRRNQCAYARFFEPVQIEGPSGFSEPPRPFVWRASHLDGHTVEPGVTFRADMHVFNNSVPALDYLTRTFTQLAHDGLGPGRARVELVEVIETPVAIDLSARRETVHIKVTFLTPTELKEGGLLVDRPEFGTLFSRLRDRISALRGLYGDGPLEVDFKAQTERARLVKLAHCDLRYEHAERRSSRTGQRHSIGGFVGTARYEGDLGEFVPYLEAGFFTGVGRQTVWGKGCIQATAR